MHPLDLAIQADKEGDSDLSERILRELEPQKDYRVLYNLGFHEMKRGNLKKGYEYFNYGRHLGVFGLSSVGSNIWYNESLKNKTLLFRCEGGYGDQIINFRFAQNFKAKGANVLISASKDLLPIFSRHGFVCIENEFVKGAYFDYWVPAMSAPYVLNMEYKDLSGKPYLSAIKKTNISNNNNLKVGLRWSGNPKYEHEQFKRFPKELMINLSEIPDINFYSLQKNEDLVDNLPFKDFRNELNTWEDTASIIASCDLVISACTSVAHLSASMGIPTWIVVPIIPYYIWTLPGNKAPWYDCATLYRQTKFGDWTQPFNLIKNDLIKLRGQS